MKNEKKLPILLDTEQGNSISVVGNTYRILASGKDTDGAFATIEMLVPPGGGPGPHAHAGFEESFYVVDGEVEFTTEAGRYTAVKGSFVNIPKGGMVHCFKNKTQNAARLLCTVVPAGLEQFFEEVGQPVDNGRFLPLPVMDKAYIQHLQQVAERYGQQVFAPDYFD
ncbi:cupin domain-containing protein [Dyadobacter flavalbus]|uniref:Cupin domain-containing protein n=1 Tax=Dyadobacter flavalbus TaxID=2579942 RepID=A0A5M8QVB5_9BACT|nr:cupin domain-containing protein [Dyadobacter flavalbus]KAA6439000.1 cupin domain-containing protein [Dyadobacter flavalbus]